MPQSVIDEYAETRRDQDAGRVIAKELGIVRQMLRWHGVRVDWDTPRWISRLRPLERPVPSPRDLRVLTTRLGLEAKLGVFLALLGGLRNEEVYKLTWNDVRFVDGTLTIPAEIRKCGPTNVIPLCDTLYDLLVATCGNDRNDPLIRHSKSAILAELRRHSRHDRMPTWYGLQPARRCLVTWAEDAGYTQDTISLVTGHARSAMVSRYSSGSGRLELKRKIIEDVERRYLNG